MHILFNSSCILQLSVLNFNTEQSETKEDISIYGTNFYSTVFSKILVLKASLANKMYNTGLLKSTLSNHENQISKIAAYSSFFRPLISEYE